MRVLALNANLILKLANPSIKKIDDFQAFLTTLAVPQATALLISEDYSCSIPDAAHMAWLSEPYGQREFPLDDEDPSLIRLRNACAADTSVQSLCLIQRPVGTLSSRPVPITRYGSKLPRAAGGMISKRVSRKSIYKMGVRN